LNLEEKIDPKNWRFILRIDDNYIDASIRNKLRKIKKELLGGVVALLDADSDKNEFLDNINMANIKPAEVSKILKQPT